MEHYTWDSMEKEVLSQTIARKIITGDKAMVAQVFLAKGAVVPEHQHESEQITYILQGAMKFESRARRLWWPPDRYCASPPTCRTGRLRWKTRSIWTSSAPSAPTGS
jgi:hypothetical protein